MKHIKTTTKQLPIKAAGKAVPTFNPYLDKKRGIFGSYIA